MAITFRNIKDSALTHTEMDTNLASYYLSSSVSGSTITFYRSGSDGLVISSSHTLTDITGSDTTYIAGLGLDLDTGSNSFSIQNGENLTDGTLTKWSESSGQLEDSIIIDNGTEATVNGKLNILGDIYQSGSKVNLNVAWPDPGTEDHLLTAAGYILNITGGVSRSYEYSALALEHFEEPPGYFHNSFRFYTQDSEDFNYGSYLNIGPLRTGMFLKPSGSAELANISIQDKINGDSLALIYGTEIQIGWYNGERIYMGNTQAVVHITGSSIELNSPTTTIISSSVHGTHLTDTHIFTGSATITGSVTADSLVTRGGTSSQFVKGDGTLDSNTYLTSSTDTTYSASGSGLILSGTVFTNTLPDQTVTVTGEGATVITGTYPNFTVSSSDTNTTYTNVSEFINDAGYITSSIGTTYSASGSGLILSGTVFTNTLPDQTVTLTGQNITVNGTYPNFQITGSDTSDFALLSGGNTFTGTTNTFQNIVVNGTGSFSYIESITGSAKLIGDAFVVVNSNSPSQRYSGLATYDSGSLNVTASFFFDSTLNDWNYEYDNGGTVDYGVALFGPEYNTQGSPVYNTLNRLVKSDGKHHLTDSNISDNGSTVSILTNVEVTGTISGSTYYGDGSNLTGITSTDITSLNSKSGSWDTAHGWGDHSLAGYLTSYTETDPIFTAHTASSITGTQIVNWDTAHGWGDHSLAGYVTTDNDTTYSAGTGLELVGTTFNNTAPDQTVSLSQGGATIITGTYPNFTISSTDTTYTNVSELANDAGYITGYTETDTLATVVARGSTTPNSITAANFITTSDRRLKSDIEPLKDGLDTIKKFVSYEYTKGGVQDAGFMAQEVQQAIPYAIAEGEDGFLTMRDRPVLAYMHKAILELEARLAAIEEKLQ